jgi:hypothetical protein
MPLIRSSNGIVAHTSHSTHVPELGEDRPAVRYSFAYVPSKIDGQTIANTKRPQRHLFPMCLVPRLLRTKSKFKNSSIPRQLWGIFSHHNESLSSWLFPFLSIVSMSWRCATWRLRTYWHDSGAEEYGIGIIARRAIWKGKMRGRRRHRGEIDD